MSVDSMGQPDGLFKNSCNGRLTRCKRLTSKPFRLLLHQERYLLSAGREGDTMKKFDELRGSIYVCESAIWAILCIPLAIGAILDPSAEEGVWLLLLFGPYLAYLSFRYVAGSGGMILVIITILPLIWFFIGDCVRLLAYKFIYRGEQKVNFFFFGEKMGK